MSAYSYEDIHFGISDVGSEILTRFSDDMYKAESIIRELVKNASDSYYQLEDCCLESSLSLPADYREKKITIGIEGDKIFITDYGIGCDNQDIRKMIKIAVSDKKNICGATGFRGIGFWAGFSAGEKIIVRSTKYKNDQLCILEIDTKKIRLKIDPSVDIGQIMNNKENISLRTESAPKEDHYTEVIIECKEKPGKDVGEKENRLYELIHSSQEYQLNFIKSTCTQYLPDDHPMIKQLQEFYKRNNIPLYYLSVNGTLLRKDFSHELENLQERSIDIEIHEKSKSITKNVANCFYLRSKPTDKLKRKEIKSGLSGIRLFKDGYPIGKPNIYSEDMTGYEDLKGLPNLSHYLGEIHINFEDITADANGEDLTDGQYKREFIKSIRKFYKDIIDDEYFRSSFLGRIRDFIDRKEKLSNYNPEQNNKGEIIINVKNLLIEYTRNTKGAMGYVARTNKRYIDRQQAVKELALDLKKLLEQFIKTHGEDDGPKTTNAIEKKDTSGKEEKMPESPEEKKAKNDIDVEFDQNIDNEKQELKTALQLMLISKLKETIEKNLLTEILNEIESIFSGT